MQEPSRLETAIVVLQGANPTRREVNIPANQLEKMIDGNIRTDLKLSPISQEVLPYLESSASKRMLRFNAVVEDLTVGIVVRFGLKAWTRWLGRPSSDEVVNARNIINDAPWPPSIGRIGLLG